MMTKLEEGTFLMLFNRSGYVLNFSTNDFDVFTTNSIGEALCEKYGLSKGKSLNAYLYCPHKNTNYRGDFYLTTMHEDKELFMESSVLYDIGVEYES